MTANDAILDIRSILSTEINAELSDEDITRFLNARSMDCHKANKMIHKWFDWYNKPFTEYNIASHKRNLRPRDIISNVTDEKDHVFRELFCMSNLGEDKLGRPIYWERSGLSQ